MTRRWFTLRVRVRAALADHTPATGPAAPLGCLNEGNLAGSYPTTPRLNTPASITATPNPVTASIWSYSRKRTTTLTWDTGDPRTSGTVRVAIDSGPYNPARDSGGNPVAAAVTGSTAQGIELGKKYVFQLKSTAAGTPVLATVAVEGKELLGLPSRFIDELKNRIPLNQGITNVRVFPGIDSVRIIFRTRQPTVPVIAIKRTDDGALAGAAFPFLQGTRTMHDYAFPLAQNAGFNYHITAAPAAAASSGKTAEATGQFRTGFRKATVFFDHVFVHTDGDPGSLGDGDFTFDMGVGDIDSQAMLGAVQLVDDISGGESPGANRLTIGWQAGRSASIPVVTRFTAIRC